MQLDPPEPDLSQLRIIFAAARHDSGLTYDELSARSGIGRQTLLDLNSGKYNGDLKTWLKLSSVFGIGLDKLLEPVWMPSS